MFNPTLNNKLDSQDFNGFYRGVVTENNDPKESGRIQLKVYPMFVDVIDDTTLPWAIPADSSFGGAANIGGINVPTIGAHVFLFFENGDFRHPVYFAGAPAIENGSPDVPTLSRSDDGTVASVNTNASKGVVKAGGGTWDEPDSAYNPTYPNNRVYRSEKGVIIEIDDTAANIRLHVYHPSGTREEIDNAGNRTEHTVGDKFTVIVGDDNEHIQGNKETKVDGTDGNNVTGAQTIKIGGNQALTIGGTWTINASGNTTLVSPNTQVTGNVTTTGNVTLDNGTGGIVTTEHTCAFTGNPHPDGSGTCLAKK